MVFRFPRMNNLLVQSSIQFSRSVVSDSLWPHGLQQARPPCPSPAPRVSSNLYPLGGWCHLIISSSVVPFSSHRQSFPASGSFQMSQFFKPGGQSARWSKWSEVAQPCPTLCDPMDCSLPGSSLHGILQGRGLEWVAISFSRGSSWPRNWTRVSRIPGRSFNLWATREGHNCQVAKPNYSSYNLKSFRNSRNSTTNNKLRTLAM